MAISSTGEESLISNENPYLVWEIPPQEPTGGGAEEGTVTNLSPRNYVVTSIRVGDRYYTDQNETIKAMPAALQGLTAIKTAQSDRKNASATLLTFTVTQSATIYVAYDARATLYPNWLTTSFTNTGQRISTADAPLALWRR